MNFSKWLVQVEGVYKEEDPIGIVDFQAIVPSPTTRARDFNANLTLHNQW